MPRVTSTNIIWDGGNEWFVEVEAINNGSTSAGPYYSEANAKAALESIVRNDFDDESYDLAKTEQVKLESNP